MDVKYLSDGRKVAVVGKLNNQETIVQEIFYTESGDEVPSGERFVVKSLHDEPVISYQEKREKEIQANVENWKRKLNKIHNDVQIAEAELKGMHELVRQANRLLDNVGAYDFDLLIKFISGSIEWVVIDAYRVEAPVKFKDAMIYHDSYNGDKRKFEGIKLLSVFGRTNGDIEFNIYRYSDGSGSETEIHPFETYEQAVEYIKQSQITKIRESKHYSESDYKKCMELGIIFPDDCVEIVKAQIKERINNVKKKIREQMEKDDNELIKLQTSMEELFK